jgi:hypothetical protein
MYLDENSGNSISYNISNIKKITFNNGNVLVESSASIDNFLMSDTRKITFQQHITNVNDLLQLNNYTAYPNPCVNILNIKGLLPNTTFRIININGSDVLTGTATNKIDVSQLQTGVYFITLINQQNHKTLKFIKQ